jgi:putative signal transducing protein
MDRVRIGTCNSPAEAALVRAAFLAHDIPVLINAEHHASMLGGLAGAFLPLHVFVDARDAEEADELFRDLRDHDRADQLAEEADALPPDELEDAEAESEAEALHAAIADRRRRIGLLLLIGLAMAFSTPYVIGRPVLAVLLVVGGLAAMAFTMWRARPARPEIPRARIRR